MPRRLRCGNGPWGYLQCVIEAWRRSQRDLCGAALEILQAELRRLLEIPTRHIVPLTIEHLGNDFTSAAILLLLALSPFQRKSVVRIRAAVRDSDDQLVVASVVANIGKSVRARGTPRRSDGEPEQKRGPCEKRPAA
jgi:hypothetical protein